MWLERIAEQGRTPRVQVTPRCTPWDFRPFPAEGTTAMLQRAGTAAPSECRDEAHDAAKVWTIEMLIDDEKSETEAKALLRVGNRGGRDQSFDGRRVLCTADTDQRRRLCE
jgi:hypothetical protein